MNTLLKLEATVYPMPLIESSGIRKARLPREQRLPGINQYTNFLDNAVRYPSVKLNEA